ncbi:MAG: heme-binding protein [Sphingomonadales bacterium]|nr:heme-binding protein [Sphingomonadales bacterium]
MRRLAVLALLVAGPLGAAPGSPFRDAPAGPRSLPGDNLPPFAMLAEDGQVALDPPPLPPGAALPRPFGPPESTAPGPRLGPATRMALAALRACERSGHRVGVVVIDSAGEARAMLTADGADGSHVFVAMRKAEVALRFAMPSAAVGALLRRDPAAAARLTPAMFAEGGALPLRRHGRVIGAIGVSGAGGLPIGRADAACAAAGLRVG